MTRPICSVTHGKGISHACEQHRLPCTQPLGSFLEAQLCKKIKGDKFMPGKNFESCNLAWKNIQHQNINNESVLLLTVLETRILRACRANFSRPLSFGSLPLHMENPQWRGWRKALGRAWKRKCPRIWVFLNGDAKP